LAICLVSGIYVFKLSLQGAGRSETMWPSVEHSRTLNRLLRHGTLAPKQQHLLFSLRPHSGDARKGVTFFDPFFVVIYNEYISFLTKSSAHNLDGSSLEIKGGVTPSA